MGNIKLPPFVTYAFLMVTESCPLRCEYCYIKDRNANNEFPFEWMEKVKKMFTCSCKPRIIFFGGEPLLKVDLIKRIVEKYKDDFVFQVVTNGVVNLHGFLTEVYEPYRNIFDIQLSWDGNDKTRIMVNGKESNNIVYENLIKELKNGYAFEGRCVIDDNSVKTLYQTYKTFEKLSKEYLFSADFTIVHQPQFGQSYCKDLREQLEKVYNDIKKSLEKDNYIFIPRMILKFISNIYENQPVVSCDVGNYVVIRPNGDVYPCTILSQIDDRFKMGNINDNIDTEIINDLRFKSACTKDCPWKMLCDGGCRYERIKNYPLEWCSTICQHSCEITQVIFETTMNFIKSLSEIEKDKLMKILYNYNIWSVDYIAHPDMIDRRKRLTML